MGRFVNAQREKQDRKLDRNGRDVDISKEVHWRSV
jgi:hypothetical protein